MFALEFNFFRVDILDFVPGFFWISDLLCGRHIPKILQFLF
jgi:hypothetical protein